MGKRSGRARTVNIAICAVLVVLAAGSFVAWRAFGETVEASVAVVTDADGKTYELPLDTDTELVVQTDRGTNVVAVEDGAVRVREADCPNQDCVNQGAASRAGEQIVCLPHKLVVEIRGGEGVSYDVLGS